MTDLGGKTCIFSHPVYLFLREFSLQDSRGGSLFISVPAKMKKGIANRAKLSSPLASRCETVIAAISQGNIKSIEATVAIPIENEMGTPIKTNTKKQPNSVIAI
ncbi:hypothetical protein BX20_00005 [Escherichia coli O111:NM str. 2009C-4052]|nr:hypothetical protein BX20_00005 [Escherichia coli O111:NM str. 2009C-4052]